VSVDDLKVGDRVSRIRWLADRESRRYGVVEEVYDAQAPLSGTALGVPLFAVRWDDTELVERGYMRNGLLKVEAEP
jgi:hypothetical protein